MRSLIDAVKAALQRHTHTGADGTPQLVAGSIPTGLITSAMIADGTIVNADVSASAAIAYSKLNLASSVTSADMAAQTFTSFTPTLKATSTSGTHTYSAQVGRYVLVGKLLYFWMNISLSAKDATMAGTVYVDLPGSTTAINVTGLEFPCTVGGWVFNIDAGYTQVEAVVPANDTRIFFEQLGDNVLTGDISAAMVGNATKVWLSGVVPVQ